MYIHQYTETDNARFEVKRDEKTKITWIKFRDEDTGTVVGVNFDPTGLHFFKKALEELDDDT